MKMYGSTYADSLFGTSGEDFIYGKAGNDLISGWSTGLQGAADTIFAGAGLDLISGISIQFDNVARSQSRGAEIDGGGGYDTLIIDSLGSAKKTDLSRWTLVTDIKKIEEIIYNFSSATAKQTIVGTDANETIYVGETGSAAEGGAGNDYLFAGLGDDRFDGGNGDDFLSGGAGHNELTGGKGSDYFHLQLDEDYEYSNIKDFQAGSDKIAITIFEGGELVADSYGSTWYLERPLDDLGYLTYDNGRIIGRSDFVSSSALFDQYVIYEMATGSVMLNTVDGPTLLAHLDMPAKPALDWDDFAILVV